MLADRAIREVLRHTRQASVAFSSGRARRDETLTPTHFLRHCEPSPLGNGQMTSPAWTDAVPAMGCRAPKLLASVAGFLDEKGVFAATGIAVVGVGEEFLIVVERGCGEGAERKRRGSAEEAQRQRQRRRGGCGRGHGRQRAGRAPYLKWARVGTVGTGQEKLAGKRKQRVWAMGSS